MDGERTVRQPAAWKFSQCAGVLVATLAAFSIGTYLAWTSAVLPLYKSSDFSEQESSWLSSLLLLGAVAVIQLARMLADTFGRKKTIWATALLMFSCWYVIGFVQDKIWIFLARFAAGTACGAASVVVPVFTSEIVERSVRDLLGVAFQLQITAGILFAYATAFTDSQRVIAILCSAAPALLLISFPFVSESPAWLVAQGRKNEASDALKHFRRSHCCEIEEELTRLEARATEMRESQVGIFDLRNYRRETCTILGLMVFQQLSGVCVLIFYARRIFDDAGSPVNSAASTVIVGAVQMIATCFSTVLIGYAGRKFLLFISTTVMSVCMFTLSGYFHFQSSRDLSSVSWLPLVACAVFIAFFSVGSGPIPWMLIDEMFVKDARTAAYFISAICSWTFAFLVTKCFRDTVDLMGVASSFAAFGMMSLIGTAFVSALVPERKNRSPEEMQIELCRIQIQETRENERLKREVEMREPQVEKAGESSRNCTT